MIKQALIEWLNPEHEILQRKYQDLINKVGEAQWWMGSEFPEASKTAKWIYASHAQYCGRNVHAVEDKPWINTISDFREYMRTLKNDKIS